MKLDTSAFRAWCAAKSVQTCLEIKQDPTSSFRYTALSPSFHATLQQQEQQHEKDEWVNLVQVPLDACITASSSEELADRLLFEKRLGDRSEFAPYLDLFPTLFDNNNHDNMFRESFPRFWKPERFDLVKDGGQLQLAVERDSLRCDAYYQRCCHTNTKDDDSSLVPPYTATSAAAAWALACVDSRSHFLPDGRYSLTPVLDMINHDPHVTSTHMRVVVPDERNNDDRKDDDDDDDDAAASSILCLSVNADSLPKLSTTLRDDDRAKTSSSWMNQISSFWKQDAASAKTPSSSSSSSSSVQTQCSRRPEKDEVCISYGDFTNLHTLLNYGFVVATPPGNPHNIESISFRTALSAKPITIGVWQWDGRITGLETLRQLLNNNDEELYGFVAAELELALEEATAGIEQAHAVTDDLVAAYLQGRSATLQAGLNWIQENFPQVLIE